MVIFEVKDTAPDVSQPASYLKDYSISGLIKKEVTRSFQSDSQQLTLEIMLFSDDIYEGREGIQISFRPEDLRTTRNVAKYSPPSTDITTATVIIEDDDG